MSHERRPDGASGYICPRCGGALWERSGDANPSFTCRIGDTLSALELWIEHCDARNHALRTAARALAENAALARHLADWARGRGDATTARRLDEEAASEEIGFQQVYLLLDGLTEDRKSTRLNSSHLGSSYAV